MRADDDEITGGTMIKSSFDFSKAGKYKTVSAEARIARFRLIDCVIATKQPIATADAAAMVGQSILDELLASHIVNQNCCGNIAHLYPVSASEIGHSVKLADGRSFNAMCAIDSLGCPATFGMACEINSFCKDTGEKVYMKLNQQKIEAAMHADIFVSYVDNAGQASCDCCGMMNFFRHEENARDVLKPYANSGNAYLWTLSDAFLAAQMMFDIAH